MMPVEPVKKTPQEWRKEWVAALRSGKYQQGRAKLRSKNDEFCCLGVACDIYSKDGWGEIELDCYNYSDGQYNDYGYAPHGVQRAFGITANDTISLVHLNDVFRKPFSEIADYIEENFSE